MKSERQLRDEIRLREASLEDARREHVAGELSVEEFASITSRENDALDDLRVALEELAVAVSESPAAAPAGPRGVRERKRSRLIVALACFAVAAGVLVWANLGLRQAGQSATGGLNLSQTQKLQELVTEGEADVANGDDVAALSAYQQILAIEPTNVVALTEAGWLEFSAGSTSHNVTVVDAGVANLREAVTLAPTSAAPRLYYAMVAYRTPGNAALAKREFKVFLGLHPSHAQLLDAAAELHALGLSA